MDINKIRNFSIIAHIDHGKSTLADRILEITGAFSQREMVREQILDQMDLEQERGITIKLQAVALYYKADNGETYKLHLIDTPGHVDFAYEVSRSLSACEGAILVVDASQGVEAQTLANVYLALENNLEIIPVINKIDLPSADPEKVKHEIEEAIGISTDNAVLVSAKTGFGVDQVLKRIIKFIPPPKGSNSAPLKALIFDSHFDTYKGVVVYIRVIDGVIHRGTKVRMMATNKVFDVAEVGIFKPMQSIVKELGPGDVGFFVASIKNVGDTHVGDTVTYASNGIIKPLYGYKKSNPMVFCGVYSIDNKEYNDLRDALAKLRLNDAALIFEPETSIALGCGFRVGFLGLLHMEVIQERLEREYGLSLITTAPNVIYRVSTTNGEEIDIDNPSKLSELQRIEHIKEPYVKAIIIAPNDYIGKIMELSQEKRGLFGEIKYLNVNRVMIMYNLPLAEIIYDYFDKLKTITRGYASLDYEIIGYRESKLVKLDILLNREIIDALSVIVHKDRAKIRGHQLVEKLKNIIPRHNFEIPIQATIGNKVIARETIKALRKDVTTKCYGGDISRKRKLLEKQKEGKKRMKQIGNVELPQEAFIAILKVDK